MSKNGDRLEYMFCDYLATGEGRTICLMICMPYPSREDYETQPRIEDGKFVPGVLKATPQQIAARNFREKFGDYLTIGIEHVTRDEFLRLWGKFVPEAVQKISDPNDTDGPGNFQWHQYIHYNFS